MITPLVPTSDLDFVVLEFLDVDGKWRLPSILNDFLHIGVLIR